MLDHDADTIRTKIVSPDPRAVTQHDAECAAAFSTTHLASSSSSPTTLLARTGARRMASAVGSTPPGVELARFGGHLILA
jgi:hypothetical protein